MALSTYWHLDNVTIYNKVCQIGVLFKLKCSVVKNQRALVAEGVGDSVNSLWNLCKADFSWTARCFKDLTARTYQERCKSTP